MSMNDAAHVLASPDPTIGARVVRRVPLLYADGPAHQLDQPAHVRAGSGITRVDDQLVVVQDDANFLALIDPATGEARAVPLPPGDDGRRQFDDRRGNKHLKLDLEACFVAPDERGESMVVAIGSGSTSRRERIVTARPPMSAEGIVLHDAATLYAALRADPGFAPGELNVEGAVYADGVVRFFARGNGAARDGQSSADATCEIDWAALRRYLMAAGAQPAPEPRRVIRYTLGEIDGLALGFTDAAAVAGQPQLTLFSAAAEDSPDATRDGRVAGSAIGVLEAGGRARWTLLRDEGGHPFPAKVEGVLAVPGAPRQLHVVVDQDDPDAPSELCVVELTGPWFSGAEPPRPAPGS
jgi:hypothetical protein